MFFSYNGMQIYYRLILPRSGIHNSPCISELKNSCDGGNNSGDIEVKAKCTSDNCTYIAVLGGWATDHNTYADIVANLSGTYGVLVLDYPEFGLSRGNGKDMVIEDYAQLFAALLSRLNISYCHLFCHSFGARIAAVLCGGGIAERCGIQIGDILITGGAGLKPVFLKKVFKGTRIQANAYA